MDARQVYLLMREVGLGGKLRFEDGRDIVGILPVGHDGGEDARLVNAPMEVQVGR